MDWGPEVLSDSQLVTITSRTACDKCSQVLWGWELYTHQLECQGLVPGFSSIAAPVPSSSTSAHSSQAQMLSTHCRGRTCYKMLPSPYGQRVHCIKCNKRILCPEALRRHERVCCSNHTCSKCDKQFSSRRMFFFGKWEGVGNGKV